MGERPPASVMYRIILPVVLLLLTGSNATGADGIVLRSSGESLPLKIDRAKLVSRANDNSRLRLTLDRNQPFPHDYGKLALSVGGQLIRFDSAVILLLNDTVSSS